MIDLLALAASLAVAPPQAPAAPRGAPVPQPAAAAAQAPAPRAGNECERAVPRERALASVPRFEAPGWTLVDEGDFTFHYRFYARAGDSRVSALVVDGSRSPVPESKIVWEEGPEILIFMTGPVAELDRLPLCARQARGFDLERLYRTLAPRLSRP